MKTRAESLDGDLDLLRAAFSEISRLAAEVTTEDSASHRDNSALSDFSSPSTPMSSP